jgi:hypothetical protein
MFVLNYIVVIVTWIFLVVLWNVSAFLRHVSACFVLCFCLSCVIFLCALCHVSV